MKIINSIMFFIVVATIMISCQTKKTASVTPVEVEAVKSTDSTKQIAVLKNIDTVQQLNPQQGDSIAQIKSSIDSIKRVDVPVKPIIPIDPISPLEPVADKPIIYIYPKENIEVNIKLKIEGKLTHSYPKYNEKTGWNVKASPDGTLTNKSNNKEYYALFWEGTTTPYDKLTSGFVVKGTETAAFLDEKLEILGLNRREANEFIVYWLPRMENNAYNLIHFAGAEYTDKAPLEITPQPETLIRVFMLFEGKHKKMDIAPQILKPIKRKGYTVVEWGGAELKPKTNKDI